MGRWRWVGEVPCERRMDQQRTRTRDGSVEYPFLAQLEGWVFFLSFSGCESDERRQVGIGLISSGHRLYQRWTQA